MDKRCTTRAGHIKHPDAHKLRFQRELGLAIRRERHAAGLSMRQVAEACVVSIASMNKWESGQTSVPAYTLHLLENALGCNLYDLMPVMSDDEAAA